MQVTKAELAQEVMRLQEVSTELRARLVANRGDTRALDVVDERLTLCRSLALALLDRGGFPRDRVGRVPCLKFRHPAESGFQAALKSFRLTL